MGVITKPSPTEMAGLPGEMRPGILKFARAMDVTEDEVVACVAAFHDDLTKPWLPAVRLLAERTVVEL